jgi:hypothetical protein
VFLESNTLLCHNTAAASQVMLTFTVVVCCCLNLEIDVLQQNSSD